MSKKNHKIDNSLNNADLLKLKELGDPENVKVVSFEVDGSETDIIKEDDIIDQFKSSFNMLSKCSLDTPKNECMSCRRLMCLRDVINLKKN